MGLATLVALGYPTFGDEGWHHHWVGISSLLDLMALPLMLGGLLMILSAGRRVGERMEARRQRSRVDPRPVAARRGPPAQDRRAPAVLASDAERQRVSDVIAAAMGEARLSLEEGGQRIEAVWQARHRHQLAALVSDLPPLPPTAPRRLRVGVGVALALVLAFVAAVLQAIVGFWELWPVAVVASLTLALRSRRSAGR